MVALHQGIGVGPGTAADHRIFSIPLSKRAL
jgi:hypothetical protein